VHSTGGVVTVKAEENARIVNIAVGGAVAVGSGIGSFGGAFAGNIIRNNPDAHITARSDVDGNGTVSVPARDTAAIITLAGNVAVSLGAPAGVGIAFAVNDVNDTITATVDNSTVSSATGDILVDATFAKPTQLPAGLDVQIAAMAVSGGGAEN